MLLFIFRLLFFLLKIPIVLAILAVKVLLTAVAILGKFAVAVVTVLVKFLTKVIPVVIRTAAEFVRYILIPLVLYAVKLVVALVSALVIGAKMLAVAMVSNKGVQSTTIVAVFTAAGMAGGLFWAAIVGFVGMIFSDLAGSARMVMGGVSGILWGLQRGLLIWIPVLIGAVIAGYVGIFATWAIMTVANLAFGDLERAMLRSQTGGWYG